ncbi:MAG: TauD/TfdA family dioxygenase [Pseudomonadota bacterium]
MADLTVKTLTYSTQQAYPEVFPLVYGLVDESATLNETRSWLAMQKTSLLKSLSLHGAILFRGFPVNGAEDFDAFIRAFGLDSFTYEESLSNAVRVNRTELVFTANEAPPDVSIFLHHEMAQTPLFPSRLFFCCEKAPQSAGETPICRSDILLGELEKRVPAFVEKCDQLGVRYSNVMPGEDDPNSGQGRSWRSTLGVVSRREAEARLEKLGYEKQWLADGSLKATTPVLPAIRTLQDGRRVFFNQLIAAFRGWNDVRNESSKAICFGDGSEISATDMQVAIDLGDQLSFDLAWESGDVVLIDNYLVMHGRRPFSGERRVLAALVADDGTRLGA